MSDGKLISIEPRSGLLGRLEWKFPLFLIAVFGLLVPLLYKNDLYGIDDVNMWGRYMCFALIAIGLDLVWGYTGMLSLCQALFFSFGGYAMGMYLAHHGGPELWVRGAKISGIHEICFHHIPVQILVAIGAKCLAAHDDRFTPYVFLVAVLACCFVVAGKFEFAWVKVVLEVRMAGHTGVILHLHEGLLMAGVAFTMKKLMRPRDLSTIPGFVTVCGPGQL